MITSSNLPAFIHAYRTVVNSTNNTNKKVKDSYIKTSDIKEFYTTENENEYKIEMENGLPYFTTSDEIGKLVDLKA